jgi:ABC-type antimicrobial peptide transport system permease subunit
MEQLISASMSTRRTTVLTLATFSAVALLLSSLGLYGVMSYYVTQRTFEIGLRIALSLDTRGIMKLVFGRAVLMVSVGLGLGLAGALVGTRLMRQLPYETTPTDLLTLAGTSVCLAASVSLPAQFLPGAQAGSNPFRHCERKDAAAAAFSWISVTHSPVL